MTDSEERKPFFCGGSGAPLGGSTGTYTSVGGLGECSHTHARTTEVDGSTHAEHTSDVLLPGHALGPLHFLAPALRERALTGACTLHRRLDTASTHE